MRGNSVGGESSGAGGCQANATPVVATNNQAKQHLQGEKQSIIAANNRWAVKEMGSERRWAVKAAGRDDTTGRRKAVSRSNPTSPYFTRNGRVRVCNRKITIWSL